MENVFVDSTLDAKRFTRLKWRVWIETIKNKRRPLSRYWFTRLKWRVWIETCPSNHDGHRAVGSPVLNGGCGLKLGIEGMVEREIVVHPS